MYNDHVCLGNKRTKTNKQNMNKPSKQQLCKFTVKLAVARQTVCDYVSICFTRFYVLLGLF